MPQSVAERAHKVITRTQTHLLQHRNMCNCVLGACKERRLVRCEEKERDRDAEKEIEKKSDCRDEERGEGDDAEEENRSQTLRKGSSSSPLHSDS